MRVSISPLSLPVTLLASTLLAACSTAPSIGGGSATAASGSASGSASAGANAQLESQYCSFRLFYVIISAPSLRSELWPELKRHWALESDSPTI